MQFVNHTKRKFYTSMSGMVNPGNTVPDRGAGKGTFSDVLGRIIAACGNSLYIVLDQKERKLVEKILELDVLGRNFDRNSIPKEILDDPTGEKRLASIRDKGQFDAQKKIVDANNARKRSQMIVDGEVNDPRSEGEDADAALRAGELGGFKDLLAENAKIAAKAEAAKTAKSLTEDPIVRGLKKTDGKGEESADGVDVPEKNEDLAKGAEAEPPKVTTIKSSKMDANAASIASQLDTFGNGKLATDEATEDFMKEIASGASLPSSKRRGRKSKSATPESK